LGSKQNCKADAKEKWRILYHAAGEQVYEITATDMTRPYFKVKEEGNQILISTIDMQHT